MNVWKVAKPPIWAAFRMVAGLNVLLNGHKYRYVFILGHMRSGSTLLSHILASHADFVGAGETHIFYHTPADLPKLVLRTSELLRRPVLRQAYIVDQINHPYAADEVLLSERIYRCIILLREPNGTLKSMMNLSIWQEHEALQIYINRLETLTRYGLLLRERALLVQYNDLIDDTEQTLASLTRFLGLNLPLIPNYSTHRMTGKVAGYGDPSDNIKAGHIVRTPDHNISIGDDTLTAATRAFLKCRELLEAVTADRAALYNRDGARRTAST